MSEYKITYAVQKEILHFLDCAPNRTADTGQIRDYLFENLGYLHPDLTHSGWLGFVWLHLSGLHQKRLVVMLGRAGYSLWKRTAKDAGEYLAALEASENETPEPAYDREAIDAAWREMRAEM